MYKSYLYYATDAIGHHGSTQTSPIFSLCLFSCKRRHSLAFSLSFTQSYIHTYARAQITYTHFFMFVNILFLPLSFNYLISAISHFINYLKTIFYTIMYV